jgi:hypothetical protein
MDVIGLLQSKKRCLRRLLEVSERFLTDAERGDLSELEAFEARRGNVIRTLELIDRHITQTVRAIPLEARTADLSRAVELRLGEERELLHAIMRLDGRILTCIESEKQRLQQQILATRRSHEIAGRFKSTWMPESGEGLDQKA